MVNERSKELAMQIVEKANEISAENKYKWKLNIFYLFATMYTGVGFYLSFTLCGILGLFAMTKSLIERTDCVRRISKLKEECGALADQIVRLEKQD